MQTKIDYKQFRQLDSIAMLCLIDPSLKIKLVGHADKTGKESNNIRLSKQRAVSLKKYLVKVKHISEKNILLEWHGSAVPARGIAKTNNKLNRRAEITLLRE